MNLGAAAVRGELIKHTGWGGVGRSAIDSDIAGKSAKAPEIDRQLGSEPAKERVSEKVAKATFMYSFSGGQQRGATLPQLRVAILNPETAPPFVSDALDRMTKRPWYLYQDSGRYRFESRPNLNRILVDREERVRSEPDKVRDFAKQTLNDLIGDATFREHLMLRGGDVDWERGAITVTSPRTAHHEGKESRVVPIFPELRPYLAEIFEEAEPGTEYVITRYRQRNCNLRA